MQSSDTSRSKVIDINVETQILLANTDYSDIHEIYDAYMNVT